MEQKMVEPCAKKPHLTGALARLTEDTVTDILLRLPAKSVLRCGAVCRALHGITTDPGFHAAHARLQPAGVVLYTYLYLAPPPSVTIQLWEDHTIDTALDVVPVSSSESGRRRLVRYPKMPDWLLLASSDSVLLFKKTQEFFVLFNPTTRQWAELPRLPHHQEERFNRSDREFAFYLDVPSGEFRLLCRRNFTGSATKWCILSTGSAAEPRDVDMRAAEAAGITELVPCLRTSKGPHVPLHGRLHWPPHQQAAVTGQTEMVVFDMSSEMFHLMAGPPTTTGMLTKLFDMDGLLVTADFGKVKHVDLWFLEDYDTKRWELRHRVASPWGSGDGIPVDPSQLLSVAAAGDREGNIMLGNTKGLVVYNVRTKTVKAVDSVATSDNDDDDVLLSRHVFKESLVQHPGFVAAAQSSIDLSLVHF
ncbi:unnamed protein product [Urochloa decumbens]|uniref:F-box domain-containing protein n=1 Tax=Urochloa decumbens TaxID=240449 RepID=A0ABC9FZZ5_9POAL